MQRRSQSLDVLRGLAVLGVMGPHIRAAQLIQVEDPVATLWADIGGVGVDLFFVLSGFLVSGLLVHEYTDTGSVRIGRFLLRRGFKIWPPFYAYLAGVIAWLSWSGSPPSGRGIVAEALFFQNYAGFIWAGHTWSLAVEEHFYLLLALAVVVLLRVHGHLRRLPILIGTVCVVAFLARVITMEVWRAPGPLTAVDALLRHAFPTHLRLDTLAVGVALRWWYHHQPERVVFTATRWTWPLATTFVLAVMPLAVFEVDQPYTFTFGPSVVALGCAALVLVAIGRGLPDVVPTRVLAWVGRNSYGIYLWHMAALVWLMPTVKHMLPIWTFWRFVAVYCPLAILVGVAATYLIERPALALRDHVLPQSRKQPHPELQPVGVGG